MHRMIINRTMSVVKLLSPLWMLLSFLLVALVCRHFFVCERVWDEGCGWLLGLVVWCESVVGWEMCEEGLRWK